MSRANISGMKRKAAYFVDDEAGVSRDEGWYEETEEDAELMEEADRDRQTTPQPQKKKGGNPNWNKRGRGSSRGRGGRGRGSARATSSQSGAPPGAQNPTPEEAAEKYPRPRDTLVPKGACQIVFSNMPPIKDSGVLFNMITILPDEVVTIAASWAKVESLLSRFHNMIAQLPGVLFAFLALETHGASKGKKPKRPCEHHQKFDKTCFHCQQLQRKVDDQGRPILDSDDEEMAAVRPSLPPAPPPGPHPMMQIALPNGTHVVPGTTHLIPASAAPPSISTSNRGLVGAPPVSAASVLSAPVNSNSTQASHETSAMPSGPSIEESESSQHASPKRKTMGPLDLLWAKQQKKQKKGLTPDTTPSYEQQQRSNLSQPDASAQDPTAPVTSDQSTTHAGTTLAPVRGESTAKRTDARTIPGGSMQETATPSATLGASNATPTTNPIATAASPMSISTPTSFPPVASNAASIQSQGAPPTVTGTPAQGEPPPPPPKKKPNKLVHKAHYHILIAYDLTANPIPEPRYFQRLLQAEEFVDVQLTAVPNKMMLLADGDVVRLVCYAMKGWNCEASRRHLLEAATAPLEGTDWARPAPPSLPRQLSLIVNSANCQKDLLMRLATFEQILRTKYNITLSDRTLPSQTVAPTAGIGLKGQELFYFRVVRYMRDNHLFVHQHGIYSFPQDGDLTARCTLTFLKSHDEFITGMILPELGLLGGYLTWGKQLRKEIAYCLPIFPLARINYELIELADALYCIKTNQFRAKPTHDDASGERVDGYSVPPLALGAGNYCFAFFGKTAAQVSASEPASWLGSVNAQGWPLDIKNDFLCEIALLFRDPPRKKKRLYLYGPKDCGKSSLLIWLERVYATSDIARLNSGGFPFSNMANRKIGIFEEFDCSCVKLKDYLRTIEGGRDVPCEPKGFNTKNVPILYNMVFTSESLPDYTTRKNEREKDKSGASLTRLTPFHCKNSLTGTLSGRYQELIKEEAPMIIYYCTKRLLAREAQVAAVQALLPPAPTITPPPLSESTIAAELGL